MEQALFSVTYSRHSAKKRKLDGRVRCVGSRSNPSHVLVTLSAEDGTTLEADSVRAEEIEEGGTLQLGEHRVELISALSSMPSHPQAQPHQASSQPPPTFTSQAVGPYHLSSNSLACERLSSSHLAANPRAPSPLVSNHNFSNATRPVAKSSSKQSHSSTSSDMRVAKASTTTWRDIAVSNSRGTSRHELTRRLVAQAPLRSRSDLLQMLKAGFQPHSPQSGSANEAVPTPCSGSGSEPSASEANLVACQPSKIRKAPNDMPESENFASVTKAERWAEETCDEQQPSVAVDAPPMCERSSSFSALDAADNQQVCDASDGEACTDSSIVQLSASRKKDGSKKVDVLHLIESSDEEVCLESNPRRMGV
ncbi:MAG: hypothetical protein SGPRY_014596 [Prymnesium sp.]